MEKIAQQRYFFLIKGSIIKNENCSYITFLILERKLMSKYYTFYRSFIKRGLRHLWVFTNEPPYKGGVELVIMQRRYRAVEQASKNERKKTNNGV